MAPPTTAERVEACRKHFQKSMEWKNEKLGILEMRRHYANYFKGYPDFKPVRMALVSSMDKNEILEILGQIESTFSTFSLELAP